MGILADQAFRLLREEWSGAGGAQELSQELYLILTSPDPVQITSPVQITNPTNDPAISIANTNPDGTAPAFNITGPVDGAITFNNAFGDTVAPPESATPSSSGGGGTPGKIISGSGSTYTVGVYADGKTLSGTVKATQLQIDPAETIPAGTWVNVVKSGAFFFLFTPVWL